jgi:hypothetical protein
MGTYDNHHFSSNRWEIFKLAFYGNFIAYSYERNWFKTQEDLNTLEGSTCRTYTHCNWVREDSRLFAPTIKVHLRRARSKDFVPQMFPTEPGESCFIIYLLKPSQSEVFLVFSNLLWCLIFIFINTNVLAILLYERKFRPNEWRFTIWRTWSLRLRPFIFWLRWSRSGIRKSSL